MGEIGRQLKTDGNEEIKDAENGRSTTKSKRKQARKNKHKLCK